MQTDHFSESEYVTGGRDVIINVHVMVLKYICSQFKGSRVLF